MYRDISIFNVNLTASSLIANCKPTQVMSLQALDKASRQKIAVWAGYAHSGSLKRCEYNAVLGAVEVRYTTGFHQNLLGRGGGYSDAVICSPADGVAIIAYLKGQSPPPPPSAEEVRKRTIMEWKELIMKHGLYEPCIEREAGRQRLVFRDYTTLQVASPFMKSRPLTFPDDRAREDFLQTFWAQIAAERKAIEEIKRRAEHERQAPVRLASFPKWAAAGFPIYSLCQRQCSGGYNPMSTLQGKGMWIPEGFTTEAELESAFWEHLTSKGCATCSTCGKRPTVYRRFTPPPNTITPCPIPTEQPGLWSSLLGEVTTCGFHWVRNVYTGYGATGAKFELKPAKSGITLRCCDNVVSLDA